MLAPLGFTWGGATADFPQNKICSIFAVNLHQIGADVANLSWILSQIFQHGLWWGRAKSALKSAGKVYLRIWVQILPSPVEVNVEKSAAKIWIFGCGSTAKTLRILSCGFLQCVNVWEVSFCRCIFFTTSALHSLIPYSASDFMPTNLDKNSAAYPLGVNLQADDLVLLM